jgi:hypothetical protein
VKPAVNIKRLLRYGPDVNGRDHADTPELRRLYELYDANLEAGACGTCAMDLAMLAHAKEFGRTYDPGKRQCARRPPRPDECDRVVTAKSELASFRDGTTTSSAPSR